MPAPALLTTSLQAGALPALSTLAAGLSHSLHQTQPGVTNGQGQDPGRFARELLQARQPETPVRPPVTTPLPTPSASMSPAPAPAAPRTAGGAPPSPSQAQVSRQPATADNSVADPERKASNATRSDGSQQAADESTESTDTADAAEGDDADAATNRTRRAGRGQRLWVDRFANLRQQAGATPATGEAEGGQAASGPAGKRRLAVAGDETDPTLTGQAAAAPKVSPGADLAGTAAAAADASAAASTLAGSTDDTATSSGSAGDRAAAEPGAGRLAAGIDNAADSGSMALTPATAAVGNGATSASQLAAAFGPADVDSQGKAASPAAAADPGTGSATGAALNVLSGLGGRAAALAQAQAQGLRPSLEAAAVAAPATTDAAAGQSAGSLVAPAVPGAGSGFAAELARAAAPATGTTASTASSPTAAEVHLPTPVNDPDFLPRLGGELAVLARDGVQEARVQLNPLELGPIAVQITLDGQAAQVNLSVEHGQTRELLEQAMPSLAAALREQGLTLTGGGVFQQPRQTSRDGESDGQGRNRGQGNPGREGTDGRTGAVGGSSDGLRARRSAGVLDLYA